jgi:hypothetical protein
MQFIVRMRCQPSASASKNFDPRLAVPGRGRHADAGAVDQDVERAEGFEHALDRASAIRRFRHVGADGEEFRAEHLFVGETIQTGRINIDAGDAGAGAGERARHHPAHAARCSGHHRDAIRQQLLFCHERPPARTMANRARRFNRAVLKLVAAQQCRAGGALCPRRRRC